MLLLSRYLLVEELQTFKSTTTGSPVPTGTVELRGIFVSRCRVYLLNKKRVPVLWLVQL